MLSLEHQQQKKGQSFLNKHPLLQVVHVRRTRTVYVRTRKGK